jgi:DNA-binding MarR family transcriptional regulator
MDAPRWLDEHEQHAWRGYRRMRALLDLRVYRDLAEDSGLSDADYDVLSNLGEDPRPWRVNELADRMLWSKSRLSHQLSRMARRGLIAKRDCPGDGRGATVTLTREGRAVITAAAPAHVESVRRHFIDLLTPDQIAALGAIADTVIAHLNAPEHRP